MGIITLVEGGECELYEDTSEDLRVHIKQWSTARPSLQANVTGYDSVTMDLYVTVAIRNVMLPLVAHFVRGDERIFCAASELFQRYVRSLDWLFFTPGESKKRKFDASKAVPLITLEVYTEDSKRMHPLIESAVSCTVLIFKYWGRDVTTVYSEIANQLSIFPQETRSLLDRITMHGLIKREGDILRVVKSYVAAPSLFTFFETFDCALWDDTATLPVAKRLELRTGASLILMFAELDSQLIVDHPWYTAVAIVVILNRIAFGDEIARGILEIGAKLVDVDTGAIVHRINRIVQSLNDFTNYPLYWRFFRTFLERPAAHDDFGPRFARTTTMLDEFQLHVYEMREFVFNDKAFLTRL